VLNDSGVGGLTVPDCKIARRVREDAPAFAKDPGNSRGYYKPRCSDVNLLLTIHTSSTVVEYAMAARIRPLVSSTMSNARRKTAPTRLAALNRQFSSSPQAMAFQVKKLGVVGAGQMVQQTPHPDFLC
jgi:hypothetical protein